LAVKTATTPTLVDLGLRWIASKGKIKISKHSDDEIEIGSTGIPDPLETVQLEESIRLAFKEIQAFERYLNRVELDRLTTELG
jgi:hypothetical protein